MSSISGGGAGGGPAGVNLSLGGLVTGMDSQTVIQKLIQFESLPIQLMNSQIANINKLQAAWTDISAGASTFLTAAQTLNLSSTWTPILANASDSTIATATASTGSIAGTYVIKPNNGASNPMALVEQDASNVYTSSTTALGLTGTFNLGLGSSTGAGTGSVSVASTDTLTTLASKINAANAGVSASVVQTGTTSYKLVLTGNNTGAANAIHYNDNSSGVLTSLGLITGPTNSVDRTAAPTAIVQASQDAKITINGLAVQSASNTLTAAIPGVTIKLVNLTATNQVTVTNSMDTTGIQKSVQAFVDGFNGLVNTAAKYNSQGGPLQGNPSLLSLLRDMSSNVLGVVKGLPTTMNQLQQIGITIQKTGQLAFDTGKFQSQLAVNPSGVQAIFNQASTGISQVVNTKLTAYTQSSGIFSYLQTNLNNQIQNIQNRESALQRRLALLQTDLVTKFSKMEQMIGQLRAQGNALASIIGSLTPATTSSTSGSSH